MKQRTFPILAVLLLAAALSGCQSTAAGDSAGLSIHFIDPGQTSSALLLCGGQAMLIDGGSAERGSQVAGYLSQQGITYLDYVVCTSADETHMGGLSGPLYTCAVGQVLSPVEDAGSPVFADFRRYTEAQGLSPAVPEAGTVFPLGDAQVTVVETDDAAQTLSLQVDYGDTSLQFTSDLEDAVAAVASEAEGELPLGALVAGSDGTQFSSSTQYRPRLNPERLRPSGGGALFWPQPVPSSKRMSSTPATTENRVGTAARRIPPAVLLFVCHSGSPGRRRSSILTYIRITCIIQL